MRSVKDEIGWSTVQLYGSLVKTSPTIDAKIDTIVYHRLEECISNCSWVGVKGGVNLGIHHVFDSTIVVLSL